MIQLSQLYVVLTVSLILYLMLSTNWNRTRLYKIYHGLILIGLTMIYFGIGSWGFVLSVSSALPLFVFSLRKDIMIGQVNHTRI